MCKPFILMIGGVRACVCACVCVCVDGRDCSTYARESLASLHRPGEGHSIHHTSFAGETHTHSHTYTSKSSTHTHTHTHTHSCARLRLRFRQEVIWPLQIPECEASGAGEGERETERQREGGREQGMERGPKRKGLLQGSQSQ